MTQVIIYEPVDGQIAILIPTQEVLSQGKTVLQVAVKDVPAGKPFKIVESSTLPTDKTFRSSWEWDGDLSTDNDGVGGNSYEFEEE